MAIESVNVTEVGIFIFSKDWASLCGGVVKANNKPADIITKNLRKNGVKCSIEYKRLPLMKNVKKIAIAQNKININKNFPTLVNVLDINTIIITSKTKTPKRRLLFITAHRRVMPTTKPIFTLGSNL